LTAGRGREGEKEGGRRVQERKRKREERESGPDSKKKLPSIRVREKSESTQVIPKYSQLTTDNYCKLLISTGI
jgi:hypothetical protein